MICDFFEFAFVYFSCHLFHLSLHFLPLLCPSKHKFTLPTSAPQTIKDVEMNAITTSTPTTTTLLTTEVAITTEAVATTTPPVTPPTTPEPTVAPTTPLETTTPLDDPSTTHNHATTASSHQSTATAESNVTTAVTPTPSLNVSEVEEKVQVGLLTPTPTPRGFTVDSYREEAAEFTLPTLGPTGEAMPSEVVTLSKAELDIDALIDTGVSVSSASAPSGDGEAGLDSSDFPISPDVDYQSDSADVFLPVSVVPQVLCCWELSFDHFI